MLLEVVGIEKKFSNGFLRPRKTVLNKINFALPKGSTTGFIGVNGSGKTTTLKCILGFIFADAGQIFFDSRQMTLEQFRKQVGYLPERPYFYDFLTAEEFLAFHWEISGGGPGFQEKKIKF